MLPYFALIALGLAGEPLLSRHPEYRRKFLLLFGLACWLLASLRYVTGFDYRSYEAVFQKIAGQGLASLTAREPGYFLLNWTTALWGGCSATRFLRISDKINEKKLLAFSMESHEHMQE